MMVILFYEDGNQSAYQHIQREMIHNIPVPKKVARILISPDVLSDKDKNELEELREYKKNNEAKLERLYNKLKIKFKAL